MSTFLLEAAAMTGEAAKYIMGGMAAIACAIAVFTGFSQGIGEALVAAKAVEAIGRNPDATPEIKSNMIMGIALSETTGIYGLLISILLLFLVVMPIANA
jgi:F-type H+-transporting ATPase subunit c